MNGITYVKAWDPPANWNYSLLKGKPVDESYEFVWDGGCANYGDI